jgi:hypothetical protein
MAYHIEQTFTPEKQFTSNMRSELLTAVKMSVLDFWVMGCGLQG